MLCYQRLWHMDQDRQRGLGRFAEWVGASAVAQDKLIRTLGLEHAAKADFAISRKLLCHARHPAPCSWSWALAVH